MNETESNNDPGHRCDSKQLALLQKCSADNDITEWNLWRKNNPNEEIWLQGADLAGTNLAGVNLVSAYLQRANFNEAHLEDAYFEDASLENAIFMGAHLKGANLFRSYLEGATFLNARLEGVELSSSDMRNTCLSGTYLENSLLASANLEGSDMYGTNLIGAKLRGANLTNAKIQYAHLEGADLTACIVDGLTLIWECHVDRRTDFRSVGLNSCRIEEGVKYLLEYNKRQMNWEDWYKGKSESTCAKRIHKVLTLPVRMFWWLSDYGLSTIRILVAFLVFAVLFAFLYWSNPDSIVVNGEVGGFENFLHVFYFSVVTMTTLGFGDIVANPQSSCGQVLLIAHVCLGYFLLGTIVTRLSILFSAGGPAGRFSMKEPKEE